MPSDDGLFGGLYARGGAAAAVSDAAWLEAVLEFEAALARARARRGDAAPEIAERIAAPCRPERFDLRALRCDTARHASPEWGTLGDPLALTGSAAAWCRDLLEGLEVHPERMRAQLGDRQAELGCAPELIERALTGAGPAG